MVAVPAVGRTRFSSMRRVVVLPAPLGPRNPVTRPGRASNDRPSTARTVLYTLVSPFTRMPSSAMGFAPFVTLARRLGARACRAPSRTPAPHLSALTSGWLDPYPERLRALSANRAPPAQDIFGYADPVVLDGTSIRPADVRFSGSAAGGQAKAIVDGDGRLVDLTVDALLLRRPPRGIADAILSAVQQAQDEAAEARAAATPSTSFDAERL